MNRKPRPLVPNDHESSPPGHFILTTKKIKREKSKRRQKREAEVEEDEDEDLNCRCCIFRRKFDNFSIFSARQNISTHVQNEKKLNFILPSDQLFFQLCESKFFFYIFLYIYIFGYFFFTPSIFSKSFLARTNQSRRKLNYDKQRLASFGLPLINAQKLTLHLTSTVVTENEGEKKHESKTKIKKNIDIYIYKLAKQQAATLPTEAVEEKGHCYRFCSYKTQNWVRPTLAYK